MNECRSYKLACTKQPYVRTQHCASKVEIIIIQLGTVLINSTNRLQQPKAIADTDTEQSQLVKACTRSYLTKQARAKNNERLYTGNVRERIKSLTSRNEFESCNEQSYVRTQIAIAKEREYRVRERIKRLTSRNDTKEMNESSLTSLKTLRTQLAIAVTIGRSAREKRRKLSVRERIKRLVKASSLTSLKTFDSCNEQPYVRTQLKVKYLRGAFRRSRSLK